MEAVLRIFQTAGDFMRLYWIFCVGYALLVNIIAYAMYALDKKYAQKRQWRIPEASLIAVALLGGSAGALVAMRRRRHKTKHKKFTVTVPLVMIVQIAVALCCLIASK